MHFKFPANFTQIVNALRAGDGNALPPLIDCIYLYLHALARTQLAQEEPGHVLQHTALVHEACLRLMSGSDGCFESQRHFFAAAEAMHPILVGNGRRCRPSRAATERSVGPCKEMTTPPEGKNLHARLKRAIAVILNRCRLLSLQDHPPSCNGIRIQPEARNIALRSLQCRRFHRTQQDSSLRNPRKLCRACRHLLSVNCTIRIEPAPNAPKRPRLTRTHQDLRVQVRPNTVGNPYILQGLRWHLRRCGNPQWKYTHHGRM